MIIQLKTFKYINSIFFLYRSFAYNRLTIEMIDNFFRIQYIHPHYLVQGAKDTLWCEIHYFYTCSFNSNDPEMIQGNSTKYVFVLSISLIQI